MNLIAKKEEERKMNFRILFLTVFIERYYTTRRIYPRNLFFALLFPFCCYEMKRFNFEPEVETVWTPTASTRFIEE